jgi:hypothetical protein
MSVVSDGSCFLTERKAFRTFCLCIACQYFWSFHSSPIGLFGKLCSTYYRLIHGIETFGEADNHLASQVTSALGIQTLINIL